MFERRDRMFFWRTAATLAVLTPVGFATKFYHGPFDWWFHNYGGAIAYEMFWIVFFSFVFSSHPPRVAAVWVFAVTCALEVTQLWHPPFLQWIRSFFIGRALIGNGFDWWDFPYYAVGSFFGWLVEEKIVLRNETRENF